MDDGDAARRRMRRRTTGCRRRTGDNLNLEYTGLSCYLETAPASAKNSRLRDFSKGDLRGKDN